MARYYFQRGAIKQSLKDDKDLEEALKILGDEARYESLLKPVKK